MATGDGINSAIYSIKEFLRRDRVLDGIKVFISTLKSAPRCCYEHIVQGLYLAWPKDF
jgi:hypothetical protein